MDHSTVDTSNSTWPELEYAVWADTYETFHRWIQIVGKIALSKQPWINHAWHSAFEVTSRGFGIFAIPDGDRSFSVEFDLIHHHFRLQTSDGQDLSFQLENESVARFFHKVQDLLETAKIAVSFDPKPNELPDETPFDEDDRHETYEADQVFNCWQVMVRVQNVLKEFRSHFVGKCSPVHLFWGSFDLTVTRFSGRPAPLHPGGTLHLPDRVVREAYSHEVSSCGFWPGNEAYPHAAFYAYAYPEPKSYSEAVVLPPAAFYHVGLKEFILPYSEVQRSADPRKMLLDFLQSTYEAAANLAQWDRENLEEGSLILECREGVSKHSVSQISQMTF